ncbi:unnamed protein product, partial [Rotaria sp. Silwood2]
SQLDRSTFLPEKKTTGSDIDVSRLFIYYNARVKAKSRDRKILDKGSRISFAIQALKEFGTCLESV